MVPRADSRLSRRGFMEFGAASLILGGFAERGLSAWPQQSSPQPAAPTGDDVKFSTAVNVVNVLVSVHDKDGRAVHDLTQSDFMVDEDGHPQTIKYFAKQFDVALTLGLLIDTSGSQRRVLDQERHASFEFFQHVLREDKDQAFVIHFDREVELLQDLTSSRQDLDKALQNVEGDRPQLNRRGQGGGGGYPGGGGGRRGPRPEEEPKVDGKKILQRMSKDTGGRFFEAHKKESVGEIYTNIAEELRAQYSLGFTPDKDGSDEGFHHLQLQVKRKDMAVQTRVGFYAD